MKQYEIAGIKVSFVGIEIYPLIEERFAPYEAFFSEPADMLIKAEDVDYIPVPEEKPLASSFDFRRFYKDSDSYGIYIVVDEGDGALAQIQSDLTWSEITVKTSSVHITGTQRDFLAFELLRSVFCSKLIRKGGMILHSSAISYKNQGILFSAPSGTGKSTHTKLWKKLWPDSVEIINDDTPALLFHNNVPYMYGLPWSGKGENKNMSVPLKSVVFLERSEQNVIKKSDIDSAVFFMLEQSLKPFSEEGIDKILQPIQRLIENIPIYIIGVNMNDDAAVMVRDTVFGD